MVFGEIEIHNTAPMRGLKIIAVLKVITAKYQTSAKLQHGKKGKEFCVVHVGLPIKSQTR